MTLIHSSKIKKVLGIEGVESSEYAWRSTESKPGAQIDLLIDRRDDVVNLCEMKFSIDPFEINLAYEADLRNKISTFIKENNCKKTVHLTLISVAGLKQNSHSGIVVRTITGDDLFE